MPKPPRYLKQLEQELLALGDDAMLLEELDGFVAGLLVCPELIKPSEWLPVVWGSEGGDEPAFDGAAAPHQIGPWVVMLNEWRLANYAPMQSPQTLPTPASKVGRNDPCPCGSGKKYKRCCGLN